MGRFGDLGHSPNGDRVFGVPLIFCDGGVNGGTAAEDGSQSCKQHLLVVTDPKDTGKYTRLGVAQITLAPIRRGGAWEWNSVSQYKSENVEAVLLRYLESLPIQGITLV